MLDALAYWHTNITIKSRQRADSAERMEGRLSDSKKVGAASFWITKRAIKVLLDHQATATQIGAYLVLARHTDKTGVFSTAGLQAIYTKVGIGQAVAQRAIDALCDMELGEVEGQPMFLVHKALDTMDLPHGPGDRSKIRYVLPDLDAPEEERVWIGANLVDGFRTFKQPLKRLKAMDDDPIRLLMYLYQFESMEEFGGIHPWKAIHQSAKTDKRGWGEGFWGFDIFAARLEEYSTYWTAINAVTGNDPWQGKKEPRATYDARNDSASNRFWKALHKLERGGFVYRMISVMDRDKDDPDGQVLFELGIKSSNDLTPPKGEEGLAKPMAVVAAAMNIDVADDLGRIRDGFAVIVPGGFAVYVVGIFRLRFRVSNPNNMGIKGAWARIHRGNAEALEWVQEMADRINKSRGGENPVSFPGMKNGPDDGFDGPYQAGGASDEPPF